MNRTDEEKKMLGQMNQIFNIAEVPVMDFITEFLDKPRGEIFIDSGSSITEPLILMPLEDYKKDVCLKFTLRTIVTDGDSDRVDNINRLLMHEKVCEGIGFLFYCVKSVYTPIVSKSMKDNNDMMNIKMELDQTNWTIAPRYLHELSHKKEFIDMSLSQIIHRKKENIGDMDENNQEYERLVKSLVKLNKDFTPEMFEREKAINDSFKHLPKIAISIADLHVSNLPKVKKNKPTAIGKMPKISETEYENVE